MKIVLPGNKFPFRLQVGGQEGLEKRTHELKETGIALILAAGHSPEPPDRPFPLYRGFRSHLIVDSQKHLLRERKNPRAEDGEIRDLKLA